ncbi:AEC family transporter [Maritimibacter sp. 55A14]|uniref:AEC family transporter n=1 Tax=Maritimibacter sp. 55A14 TaxID=2174844 RepID=UPI000D6079D7|nr:AEC family transporter [Maritimibacter sp. 55A14]PWE30538.1 AEC family transporter [Maritimibacter sp. 55A14]
MQALIEVTLPVFLVIGFGYLAVWRGYFTDAGVDGLMKFTQGFAIPCLLFRAISTLDLSASLDIGLLTSFYAGSASCFVLGLTGARFIFGRAPEDAVAIGFAALFANTVLLGLPIMERAYGIAALEPAFAIIAFHAAFCYGLGITTMEITRSRGGGWSSTARAVGRAMFRNALMIGIGLGFVVNLSGIGLPGALVEAIDLMIRAALPAALFGLGGVLVRYRPEGDLREISWVIFLSLLVHPGVAWLLATQVFALPLEQLRAAVVIAAMAPGVNTYVFASIYGRGMRVAASSVLAGTLISILSVTAWLAILP